jgi:two-component system, chemotaxis family, protein-glutamate methylesterase/glutaminase
MSPTTSASVTGKIRVLIVDDSLFMRAAIKKILDGDPRFEVVGQGKDGREGVELAAQLAPDVITMDFNMPRLNGAEAVRQIMARRPTPVVMLSAHTREGARETVEALGAGAVDFLTKPSGEVSADFAKLAPALLDKLAQACAATPRALAPLGLPASAATAAGRRQRLGMTTWPPTGPRVCVIGVSTGGPSALSRLVPQLPADCALAFLIVQHMPAQFTTALAERLDAVSQIEVREAKDGDRPHQGLALVAPGDRHLELDDQGKVRITDGPEVNGCRPSVDVTMKSTALVYGRRAVGVVMTGMGRDGADGLMAIKEAGGVTLAQDRESSVIWGMPRAAVENGAAAEVVRLDDLPARLGRL